MKSAEPRRTAQAKKEIGRETILDSPYGGSERSAGASGKGALYRSPPFRKRKVARAAKGPVRKVLGIATLRAVVHCPVDDGFPPRGPGDQPLAGAGRRAVDSRWRGRRGAASRGRRGPGRGRRRGGRQNAGARALRPGGLSPRRRSGGDRRLGHVLDRD